VSTSIHIVSKDELGKTEVFKDEPLECRLCDAESEVLPNVLMRLRLRLYGSGMVVFVQHAYGSGEFRSQWCWLAPHDHFIPSVVAHFIVQALTLWRRCGDALAASVLSSSSSST
jgi:hypothetical protein